MRVKPLLIGTACLLLMAPAALAACDFYMGYTFFRVPSSSVALGGGMNIQPGSDGEDTYLIPSVDVSIRLGERAVVRPGVGLCTSTGDESDSEVTLGGGFGIHLWTNDEGNFSLNLQGAIAHASGDDWSEQTMPFFAAGQYQASETAAVFFGAGFQVGRSSYGDEDAETDSDPMAFGGATFDVSRAAVSAGIQLKKGDSDTDYALVFGLNVPVG